MPRAKKDNIPFNVKLDRSISDRLSDYCEESGMTKTTAVERAITMFIDDYEIKKRILANSTESKQKS